MVLYISSVKALYFILVIVTIAGLSFLSVNTVFAPCLVGVTDCGPPPGVTVSMGADKQFYEKNDTVNINGRMYVQNYSKPIHLQFVNPTNATILGIDVPVTNATFASKIVANFDTPGIYKIITCLQSWCDTSYFKFFPEPYKLTVSNQDFLVKYKSFADLTGMESDVNSHALRVHIANATAQGLNFVIEIPRALIDSKGYDNKDTNFRVLVGMNQPDKYMQPVNFTEIARNDVSRTLAIDIPYEPVPNASGVWDYKIVPADVIVGPSTAVQSPLGQFRLGMPSHNVTCKQGLQLVIKSEDGAPACVTYDTAITLVKRGWAQQIILDSTIPNPTDNGTLVTLGEGQRDGPLLVQQILKDNVQGLVFREYPLATNTGYPITLHIGDIVSNGCTIDLTLVKIENNTATFLKQEHHDRMCPICLSENTVIDTPNGQTNVQNLKPGMLVFTQDSLGHKQTSTILKTGRMLSPQDHKMVDVILYDKRELYVSQNHPTADGRLFGDLQAGDLLDGSKIKSVELVPYNGTYTYDILPDGKTGFYWANGILVGSTLK